jgi:phospholipid/cholesterol/gamma-HCH transport system permease protein
LVEFLIRALEHVGGLGLLVRDTFRQGLRRPREWRICIEQLHHLGVGSAPIVLTTALFTGMVLALQTAASWVAFGKFLIGDVVALSIVRELGPVLSALMIGGRVGAGITAEIGSMKVTEQVDAIRALAADPVKKLVFPKVLATLVMLPLLTILANFVGILGGLLIASSELNQTSEFYLKHVRSALEVHDIFSGIGKTFFFALFISAIACYNGLRATGGADGVGRATTQTVVAASISVLVSDFFLTKLFLMF